VVLKTEKKKLDTSKTCKYCIDFKGWKGIGHTESECYTKKREAAKETKKVEGEAEKTYAQMMRPETLKILLAIALHRG